MPSYLRVIFGLPSVLAMVLLSHLPKAEAADHAVSRWTFGEGSGAVTADQIGTHDMTFVNSPAWGVNEIRFVASSGSYGRVGVLDSLTGPFAMTFELRIDANAAGTTVLLKKEDGSAHTFMLLYDGNVGSYVLRIDNNGPAVISGQQPLTIGRWYSFAVVYNGRTIEIWVDGKLDISERIATPVLTAPIYPLTLASNTPEITGAGAFTSCSFRNFTVYDSELSPALTTRSEIGRTLDPQGVIIPQSGRGNIEMSPLRLADGTWVSPYTIDGLQITPTIGWATSPDGRTWTKHPAILGHGAGSEPSYCARGFLLQLADGTIELYYSSNGGNTGNIRRVTSTDNGTTWSEPITVLDRVQAPLGVLGYTNLCVVPTGSQWVMFVETFEGSGGYPNGTGQSYQIRRAVSNDRLHWTVDSFILSNLRRFPNGMASHPSIVHVDGLWHMFYHASSQFIVPSSIFHAVSSDLVTWIPTPSPVITVSNEPVGNILQMDQVADVTVREYDHTSYFFYDTDDNTNGLADLRLRTYPGPLSELVRLDPVDPSAFATPTPLPSPVAPTGSVHGKTVLLTSRGSVVLSGKAANATKVTYRIVGQHASKKAQGIGRWHFKVPLKKRINRIIIEAQGPGGMSRLATVVVIRTNGMSELSSSARNTISP